jgi:outer membrane protein OmpU
MNKLTKLGVSALCGSLAAVSSANAGELAVTGGVDMSWLSLDGVTGNPLGIGSNISFTGSGELDNGWGVALGIALNNKNTYSNTNVTVTVPALGSLRFSHGVTGAGIDRMDDSTPNVWEEAYATGLSTGINTVSGVSGSQNIEYTPSMLPEGLTARLAWTPDADGAGIADKSSSGDSGNKGSGYDITLTATDAVTGMSGLTVYGGLSKVEQDDTIVTIDGNIEEKTMGVTYAMGAFTLGYQISKEDNGISSGAQEYENDAYGITFAVNDDLSIGYNNYESKQTNTTNVTAKASSIQVAYTMGGASIRLARADVDNAKYQTAADADTDAMTLSVSLAF